MVFRSLKTYLYCIFIAIILQLTMVAADFFLHTVHEKLETRQQHFSANERLFLKNLSLEESIERFPEVQKTLLSQYDSIIKESQEYDLELDLNLLNQRITLNKDLFSLWETQDKLHAKINAILPGLTGSVSYIHQHHIAYVKNLVKGDL